MRQAFRRYAFPMIIIAAVLAAALPLNSFAADTSTFYLTDEFAYNLMCSSFFNYFRNSATNAASANSLSPSAFLDPSSSPTGFSRFPLFLRYAAYASYTTDLYSRDFYLPVFLNDLSSVDFDFYFNLCYFDGTRADKITLKDIIFYTSDGTSFSVPFEVIQNAARVSFDYMYYNDGPFAVSNVYMNRVRVNYSSSSFFDLSYICFKFDIDLNFSSSSGHKIASFAISPSTFSISTPDSNVASVIKSLSVIAQLLDSVISQQSSSDALIIDYLDDILAALQTNTSGGSGGSGSDPGTGEGESILQEGAIKQEQLEDLGDALSNVPKPSIENITQSFDPSDTLISADPSMVQNALSIVYSWDKFLILLGLFIAVGTISYIIFGKKS